MASYTVQSGDTLSGIAQKVGLGSNYQALGYTGDPTKLQIGTVLNYGNSSKPATSSPTQGTSTPSSGSSYGDLVTNATNSLNSLVSNQQKQYQDLINSYQAQIQNAPSYQDEYNQFASQAGIPTLQSGINAFQGDISSLGDQLANMGQTVARANANADSGENAGQLQLQTQQQSIVPTNQLDALGLKLTPLEQAYATAQTNVSNQLAAAEQQRALELQPIQSQLSALPQQFQTQIGVLTTEQQNQLAYAQQQAQLANALQVANIGATATVGAAGASAQSGALASNADYQNYLKKIQQLTSLGISPTAATSAANGGTMAPTVLGGNTSTANLLQGGNMATIAGF